MEINYHHLLHRAIMAAFEAGDEILTVYETPFKVSYKSDQSPVTLADKTASHTIGQHLKEFGIPIISEEEELPEFETRKHWQQLWLVDPLDGTKEFVKRNGEFTVNIALIENGLPTLGVIYSPLFKDLYFAAKGIGAFKIDRHDMMAAWGTINYMTLNELITLAKKLPIKPNQTNPYVIVASRSHLSSETHQHLEKLKQRHSKIDFITCGSSLKLCLVAEGVADEYPRFGSTMEWDIAAGHAILQESNCQLMAIETNQQMTYNKASFLNPWFIAKKK